MAYQTALTDSQEFAETQEIGPVEQAALRSSLVDVWLTALKAAEALHVCLHPTYRRHSGSELVAFVHASLINRRNPSQMIAELLAGGELPLVTVA